MMSVIEMQFNLAGNNQWGQLSTTLPVSSTDMKSGKFKLIPEILIYLISITMYSEFNNSVTRVGCAGEITRYQIKEESSEQK